MGIGEIEEPMRHATGEQDERRENQLSVWHVAWSVGDLGQSFSFADGLGLGCYATTSSSSYAAHTSTRVLLFPIVSEAKQNTR